jgi:hypothetical protein
MERIASLQLDIDMILAGRGPSGEASGVVGWRPTG